MTVHCEWLSGWPARISFKSSDDLSASAPHNKNPLYLLLPTIWLPLPSCRSIARSSCTSHSPMWSMGFLCLIIWAFMFCLAGGRESRITLPCKSFQKLCDWWVLRLWVLFCISTWLESLWFQSCRWSSWTWWVWSLLPFPSIFLCSALMEWNRLFFLSHILSELLSPWTTLLSLLNLLRIPGRAIHAVVGISVPVFSRLEKGILLEASNLDNWIGSCVVTAVHTIRTSSLPSEWWVGKVAVCPSYDDLMYIHLLATPNPHVVHATASALQTQGKHVYSLA